MGHACTCNIYPRLLCNAFIPTSDEEEKKKKKKKKKKKDEMKKMKKRTACKLADCRRKDIFMPLAVNHAQSSARAHGRDSR